MPGAIASLDVSDFVHHVHSFNYFAEHTIAPAVLTGMIQESIVGNINEELRGRRMRIVGTRHRYRVIVVLELVVGLILNRCFCCFLFHAWFETAALYHETVNHAVEDRVIVMAALYIIDEILDGKWGLIGIKLKPDDTMGSMQFYHVLILWCFVGDEFCFFDHDQRVWHIAAKWRLWAGGDCGNFVDDVDPLDDLAKYRVAPAILARIIKRRIIGDVDEELRGR